MINVNTIYQTALRLANKSQTGGYFSPMEFNLYAPLVQKEIVSEVFQLLGINRTATNILGDVTKTANISLLNHRPVNTPTDYLDFIALRALFYEDDKWKEYEADYIDHTELGNRMRSKIDEIENTYPVVVKDVTGLKVYPKTVNLASLTYVYDFADPVWASTGEPPVYDPENSIDFVLSEMWTDIVLYKMCLLFGITVKDANLQQASVREILKNGK